MKFMKWSKDGGPESTVSGLFVVEIKNLFSIVLLRFAHGSRDAYHEHAFNSVSWVLKGKLIEQLHPDYEKGGQYIYYPRYPSLKPVVTLRSTFHKVFSIGTTYVLSFRGPWSETWRESKNGAYTTLTHGRKEVV